LVAERLAGRCKSLSAGLGERLMRLRDAVLMGEALLVVVVDTGVDSGKAAWAFVEVVMAFVIVGVSWQ
jgi:hypothetical protein